jgi:hypothetical protein
MVRGAWAQRASRARPRVAGIAGGGHRGWLGGGAGAGGGGQSAGHHVEF